MPAMIKLALPAGDLRSAVAVLLDSAGLAIEGYGEGSRAYRLPGRSRDVLTARVFREKDIPIQVALGNYDLGICSIAWVKEMRARFPGQPIVPLSDLGVAQAAVWAAGAPGHCDRLEYLPRLRLVRIASEYANIAEAFARSARLARYRVQPVWGAAEAYPPEDADCVIVTAAGESQLRESGAQPLFKLFDSSAWLVANATALKTKNLSSVTGPLKSSATSTAAGNGLRLPGPLPRNAAERMPMSRDTLRLAVPEVIRPHDMPALVATGEMDLAITGRDCLLEHRYAFPSSPAIELVDLERGQYNLSAVVSEDLSATTIDEALGQWRGENKRLIRVAAEFPATADHYARSRHFWRYQVIPIAGASEGFVPEDADLLIEGTETGKTIAENRLKVIDLLYRSTTCVIANRNAELSGNRRRVYDEFVAALRKL